MTPEEEQAQIARIERLRAECDRILEIHPDCDRENVMHTLLLLEEEPIERLRRALRRGRFRVSER